MADAIEVYNAIGAKFDAGKENPGGANNRWEFQFDQKNNQVSMNVYLDNRELSALGGGSSFLTSSLNKGDIAQIIQWLFKVKSCLTDPGQD